MMSQTDHLKSYRNKNYKKVRGWLGPDTISQLIQVDGIQSQLGVSGHVGEIGVHHGKLFILLYLLTRGVEKAVALDIFGQQELNLDRSGQGNLDILKRNLGAYAGGTLKLCVVNADSTQIGAEEIRAAAGGPLRLFSIDGGHLSHIVRHDLNTAVAATCRGGVIILDDYFNPEFPGVSEGANQFFLMDDTREFVPFLVTLNKMYITTLAHAERYIDHFTRTDLGIAYEAATKFRVYSGPHSPVRITEMFGVDVLSYSPDRYGLKYRLSRTMTRHRSSFRRKLSNSGAWRYLHGTGLAHLIRRIADKILPY
jgi:hypothetical protein